MDTGWLLKMSPSHLLSGPINASPALSREEPCPYPDFGVPWSSVIGPGNPSVSQARNNGLQLGSQAGKVVGDGMRALMGFVPSKG